MLVSLLPDKDLARRTRRRILSGSQKQDAWRFLRLAVHPGFRTARPAKKGTNKEKRAACDGKRPKSREETPNEGSDSARRYRTLDMGLRCRNSRGGWHVRLRRAGRSSGLCLLQPCLRMAQDARRGRGDLVS